MNDRNLLKGVLLVAIALAFGTGALRYPLGTLARAGPGLFPLLVSGLLLLLGLVAIVRSRFQAPVPPRIGLRNAGLVAASLAGFALVSSHVGMIAGIVVLVFVATRAGSSRSLRRNVAVAAALIAIAFAFEHLLGLSLPLV